MKEHTTALATVIVPSQGISVQCTNKKEGGKASHILETQTQKREEGVPVPKDAIDMMCCLGGQIERQIGAKVRADSANDFVVEYSGPKENDQIVREIQSIMKEGRLRLIGCIRVVRILGRPMGLSTSPAPPDAMLHAGGSTFGPIPIPIKP